MAPHTHHVLEWCPDVRCLPGRLRAEAEVARTSNRGQHPAIKVMTHAAALRHAADIVEQSLPIPWCPACHSNVKGCHHTTDCVNVR